MDNSNHSVKVTFWNARGVRNKLVEFYNFLCNEDVDICGICETKLSTNVNLRSNPNYILIRNDREAENPGGGVAIAIKSAPSNLKLFL